MTTTARTKPDAKLKTRPIDPVAARELVESERWTSKVEVDEETGCHVWLGTKIPAGYGMVSLSGGMFLAHRVAVVAATGTDIEPGLTIDHLCRRRACVSFGHLEAVTQRVNTLRGAGPAAVQAKRTHCPAGHELVEGNLYEWEFRRGHRECLICHNERSRRNARKMNAAIKEAREMLGITQRDYIAAYGGSTQTALDIIAALNEAIA